MTPEFDPARVHERIELSYLAMFETPVGEAPGQGVVLDLSKGGALIGLAAHIPEIGTETKVLITPPDGGGVEVPATVVRHEELAFAVEFAGHHGGLTRLLDQIRPIRPGETEGFAAL